MKGDELQSNESTLSKQKDRKTTSTDDSDEYHSSDTITSSDMPRPIETTIVIPKVKGKTKRTKNLSKTGSHEEEKRKNVSEKRSNEKNKKLNMSNFEKELLAFTKGMNVLTSQQDRGEVLVHQIEDIIERASTDSRGSAHDDQFLDPRLSMLKREDLESFSSSCECDS